MSTVKTVEVNFRFVYVDKRRKYSSKDFGLKSIPYGVPDDWNVKNYSDDMDEIVNCPHCGKEVTFGSCYTSKEIHTPHGFGYAVCDKCYNMERTRENKWRSN